jgi:hypothetical protein
MNLAALTFHAVVFVLTVGRKYFLTRHIGRYETGVKPEKGVFETD